MITKTQAKIRIDRLYHDPGSSLISVGFAYPNRYVAQRVAQELISTFIDENVRLRGELSVSQLADMGLTAEMSRPASLPGSPVGPDVWPVVGIAFAESVQLGLILALFRRRRAVAYT